MTDKLPKVRVTKASFSPAIIISIVATLVSIIGLANSCRATHIAKNSFLIGNRPYVNADLEKFEDVDSYVKIEREGNWAHLMLRPKLQNRGKVPAVDVKIAGSFYIAGPRLKGGSSSLPTLPNYTLGIEQDEVYTIEMQLSTSRPIEALMKDLDSGQWKMEVELICNYRSCLNKRASYCTRLKYMIQGKKALLLSRDMT